MTAAIDISGQRFGRLTALRRDGRTSDGKASWRFRCDCGNEATIAARVVRLGNSQSCGCLAAERRTKHGLCGTRLYRVWDGMHQRCENPNHSSYHLYGGRGITICGQWAKFAAFAEWALANGYADDLEIDRTDVNGNYEPSNCRFVTRTENARNTRVTTFVSFKGERIALADLADRIGIPKNTIRTRMRAGQTLEEAIG